MTSEQERREILAVAPPIIQGGMGVGVSNWRLARSVSQCGQIGVVSGTALGVVIARRLQEGDPDGNLRRALASFPWPDMAARVLDTYWIPGGKAPDAPYRRTPVPTMPLQRAHAELIVVANYVEVFLAKEGHTGAIGINLLEKVQLPTLPALFGAMLAGLDYVLMGGGIPLAIPGALDRLACWEPAEQRLDVVSQGGNMCVQTFDPREMIEGGVMPLLKRPIFLGIVSSDIVAKALARRSTGYVDGFIVENYTAGGHNAPPRRAPRSADEGPAFGPKDVPNLEGVRALERPFWLAGGYSSPETLQCAVSEGAQGVQVGSIFACCRESGMAPELKASLMHHYLDETLDVRTDFRASPTGYPFKIARLPEAPAGFGQQEVRQRVCDLGYLRTIYEREDGTLGYRCPAEPEKAFLAKGGTPEEIEGRRCLCNGLMAAIDLAQVRSSGIEPPLVTAGESFGFLSDLVDGQGLDYTAQDVIDYLLGKR